MEKHLQSFSPALATIVGLNQAIAFHEVLQVAGEGEIKKTFQEWNEQHFPYWSLKTTQRVLCDLVQVGVLLVRKEGIDRTNIYKIDFDYLDKTGVIF